MYMDNSKASFTEAHRYNARGIKYTTPIDFS